MAVKEMPIGVLISWATPVTKLPNEAIFSASTNCSFALVNVSIAVSNCSLIRLFFKNK